MAQAVQGGGAGGGLQLFFVCQCDGGGDLRGERVYVHVLRGRNEMLIVPHSILPLS